MLERELGFLYGSAACWRATRLPIGNLAPARGSFVTLDRHNAISKCRAHRRRNGEVAAELIGPGAEQIGKGASVDVRKARGLDCFGEISPEDSERFSAVLGCRFPLEHWDLLLAFGGVVSAWRRIAPSVLRSLRSCLIGHATIRARSGRRSGAVCIYQNAWHDAAVCGCCVGRDVSVGLATHRFCFLWFWCPLAPGLRRLPAPRGEEPVRRLSVLFGRSTCRLAAGALDDGGTEIGGHPLMGRGQERVPG